MREEEICQLYVRIGEWVTQSENGRMGRLYNINKTYYILPRFFVCLFSFLFFMNYS